MTHGNLVAPDTGNTSVNNKVLASKFNVEKTIVDDLNNNLPCEYSANTNVPTPEQQEQLMLSHCGVTLLSKFKIVLYGV